MEHKIHFIPHFIEKKLSKYMYFLCDLNQFLNSGNENFLVLLDPIYIVKNINNAPTLKQW